ncbi:MAG: hypothetical protein IJJ09_06985, partial [Synergistaceae bacterium]|nr:hypothetical protein [Synergistaceae bacterium]
QSTADDTMLVRIFEYITQEALDSGKIEKHQLIVTIPNAAVLFLRTKKDTPDVMNIIINTPGGSVNFDVPAMKVKKYSLEKIFEKNLFFLLPFYLCYRRRLSVFYSRDERPFQLQEFCSKDGL